MEETEDPEEIATAMVQLDQFLVAAVAALTVIIAILVVQVVLVLMAK